VGGSTSSTKKLVSGIVSTNAPTERATNHFSAKDICDILEAANKTNIKEISVGSIMHLKFYGRESHSIVGGQDLSTHELLLKEDVAVPENIVDEDVLTQINKTQMLMDDAAGFEQMICDELIEGNRLGEDLNR